MSISSAAFQERLERFLKSWKVPILLLSLRHTDVLNRRER